MKIKLGEDRTIIYIEEATAEQIMDFAKKFKKECKKEKHIITNAPLRVINMKKGEVCEILNMKRKTKLSEKIKRFLLRR